MKLRLTILDLRNKEVEMSLDDFANLYYTQCCDFVFLRLTHCQLF